jgi:FkbM family methyltransferase
MKLFGYKISLRFRVFRPFQEIPINLVRSKSIIGSHSQYFEDIFLDAIFRGKKSGFYIDIGANDPDELSNTKRFYLRGWRGINVEPNRLLFEKFLDARKEDVNINAGIGASAAEMIFYELDPHTLSTFNKDEIPESVKRHDARVVAERKVSVMTMRDLFQSHVGDREVDFLSVDTEGFEYEVLSGNDWGKNRPSVIVIEVDRDREKRVHTLLSSAGYELIHFNGLNGFYVDVQKFPPA